MIQVAFVVRLGPELKPAPGLFEGRVEEVDTGSELRFRSREELLGFLEQCFNEALRHQGENTQEAGNSES